MTERAEHIAWCKQRALEYLDAGELVSAATVMLAHLNERDDTKISADNALVKLLELYLRNQDEAGVRRWIEGFQ